MDFEKTSISTKIESFFQDNLKSEKDKESLQNGDAINLLITILQAMTVTDASDDVEIPVVLQYGAHCSIGG